ncbi:MAG: enoyl-CoA hydratase/isomerase family protein [Firmicutes bacterium]|nr:enoyl-CoA hydratase/isomerase family protein [Bacillota bacterium]
MDQILAEQLGSVQILKINRPEALNALSKSLVRELDECLDRIKQSREIRALILCGETNFAAGADIKDMVECTETEAKAFSFSPVFNRLATLDIPTIAAIEGYALGGGLELALACDLRIAAETCKLGFPEINLGIMPGAGGTIRAPRLIGPALAKELIMTGSMLDAQRALSIGLVNRVVPKGQVCEEAIKLARKLAEKAPLAMAAAKRTIDAGLEEPDIVSAVEIEAKNWAQLFNTCDQKEGMRAFIEKRTPNYTGK